MCTTLVIEEVFSTCPPVHRAEKVGRSDELIKHCGCFLLLLKHPLTHMHHHARGSKLRDSVLWGRAPEMLQISA